MTAGAPLELASQRLGHGHALIVLHGLFGSGTNWRSIARQLADIREVFLLDARNHGTSPHHEHMDYPVMAEDVCAFMDRHAIASADVLGHSMGGKIAMQLALSHPERVRRLIVVDIAPQPSSGTNAPLIKLMQSLPLADMQRRSDVERALAGHIDDPGLRAFIAQNVASDNAGLRWRINLDAIAHSLSHLMDFAAPGAGCTFDGPTLFVGGEHSDYLGDQHADIISALFPNYRLATVRDAGHWVHAEQPVAFTAVVREFLDRDVA